MKNLWYIGYVIAGLSFLGLVYAEWQVPGFVSYTFPITLVLMIAIVCGVASLMTQAGTRASRRHHYLFALLVGIVVSLTVFRAGEVFGAFRLMVALVVLVMPMLLLKALDDVKE